MPVSRVPLSDLHLCLRFSRFGENTMACSRSAETTMSPAPARINIRVPGPPVEGGPAPDRVTIVGSPNPCLTANLHDYPAAC